MESKEDPVYESAPGQPDDAAWLEIGGKLRSESLPSVREAAKSLMTALSLVKGIYLGILGFSNYLPENLHLYPLQLAAYFIPLVLWLVALYFCMGVLMTKTWDINLFSPDDISEKVGVMMAEKQHALLIAFWCFTSGLVVALGLLLVRAV